MIRFLVIFMVSGIIFSSWSQVVESKGSECHSCGRVCVDFCGKREFRSCCINFMRKRSMQNTLTKISDDDDPTVEDSLYVPNSSSTISLQQLRRLIQQSPLNIYPPPVATKTIVEADI